MIWANGCSLLPFVADTPVSISFALQRAETAAATRLSWHSLAISVTPPPPVSLSLTPSLSSLLFPFLSAHFPLHLATHFVIDLTVIMRANNSRCNTTCPVCAANPTANSALSPTSSKGDSEGEGEGVALAKTTAMGSN